MRSTKCLLIVFFVSIMLFLIPSISNAAVEYTRFIEGNNGSITLNLTGLTLDDSAITLPDGQTTRYSFALVSKGVTPTKWFGLMNYTTSTAEVVLNSQTAEIRNVMKVTDTGYLYIRDNSNSSNVVDALEVDLKLPYLQAIDYEKNTNGNYDINGQYGYGNNVGSRYYQFVKVTDKTLIEKYLNVKNNNGQITDLKSVLPEVPKTGYASLSGYSLLYTSDYESGLYLIWVKLTGDSCKDIYGCIIHDGLPNAKTVADYIQGEGPKVTKIQIFSPASGTYKTGQTVKIRVYFDKNITGTTVPTLKIKFGDSKERSVTNGTIHNDNYTWTYGHYIEYSYNIQSGDNGQLATVSLTGGAIKDTDGNPAILSCPVLTGDRTIKANTQGTITNNTENQDKTNNTSSDKKEDEKDKTSSSSSSKDKNTSSNKKEDNKKDDTTVKGKIPYTGASYTVIFAIAIILIAGIIAKIKYNDLKDIK